MDWIEKLARAHGTGGWQTLDDMMCFGKAVAEAEREACAKVCDDVALIADDDVSGVSADCAQAIRLRSNAGGMRQ